MHYLQLEISIWCHVIMHTLYLKAATLFYITMLVLVKCKIYM